MKRQDEALMARVLIQRLIPMIMITLAGAVDTLTDTVPSTTQATTTTPPTFAIDCRRQPCFQSSSCEPIFNGRTLSGYRCFCSDGYTGSYCEIEDHACTINSNKLEVCANKETTYFLKEDPYQECISRASLFNRDNPPVRKKRQSNDNICKCKKDLVFGGEGSEKHQCFKPCRPQSETSQCGFLEDCKAFPYYRNTTGWCGCKEGYRKIAGSCQKMCSTNETCTERDADLTCERAYASSVPNHNQICRCKDKKHVFGGNSTCTTGCNITANCPRNEKCISFSLPRNGFHGYCFCHTPFVLREGRCVTPCQPGFYSTQLVYDISVCNLCPIGTFQELEDQTGCTPCPDNGTTAELGAKSDSACVQKPFIRDFTPKFGPVYGGTEVTIDVPHLNNMVKNDAFIITIAEHGCGDFRLVNETSIVCTTLRARTGRPVRGAVVVSLFQPVIDQPENPQFFQLISTQIFQYKKNPNITSIPNLDTFISGGKRMYVAGDNLNSSSNPVMEVTRRISIDPPTAKTFQSECTPLNETSMACIIPNLADGLTAQQRTKLLSPEYRDQINFDIGFMFDGFGEFRNLSAVPRLAAFSRLNVFNDPLYDRFKEREDGHYVRTLQPEETFLVLTGERLNFGCGLDDIEVLIGKSMCQPTKLTTNQLTCRPPSTKPPHDEEDYYGPDKAPAVTVLLGYRRPAYLSFSIGYLEYTSEALSIGVIVGIITAAIFIVALCVLLAYCFHRKRRPQEDQYEAEIEGEKAYMRPLRDAAKLSEDNKYVSYSDAQRTEDGYLAPVSVLDLLETDLRAAVKSVCIQCDRLTLGDIIGQGNFGKVYKGTLTDVQLSNPRTVAVKTTKGKNTGDKQISEITEFFEEAIIMKDFAHVNVLSLLGVVIEKDCPYVVLPFMDRGDLKSYITEPRRELRLPDLLGYGEQVCRGMVYLSDQGFVHRDLATRNCMINSNGLVKIADFGLSRDIYTNEYYRIQDQSRPLPVKWMALESLIDYKFTVNSDVWSFGIVLWELMTRGRTPYADVDNFHLKDYLGQGYRLGRPDKCPQEIYELMSDCWIKNPEDRPSFGQLQARISVFSSVVNSSDPQPEYLEII